MIKCIERNELRKYPFIASFIGNLQKIYADDFRNDAESEEEKRETAAYIEDRYDLEKLADQAIEREFICTAIIHQNVEKIDGYLADFPGAVKGFIEGLGINQLIVMLEAKKDWFSQKNSYSPVKMALTKLLKLTEAKTYDGCFEVDAEGLVQIFPVLFWLGRCNAALPSIYLISEDKKVSMHICKHGNLHVDSYGKAERCIIEAAGKNGLEIIEREYEFLVEETDFRISGRKLQLE